MGEHITLEKMTEFAVIWLVEGNTSRAARKAGLPKQTANEWIAGTRRPEDWEVALKNAQRIFDDHIASKLSSVVDRAVEELQDRLANGDKTVDKDGVETRKPIPAKEIGVILGISFDKLRTSQGRPGKYNAKAGEAWLEKVKDSLSNRTLN